MRLEPEEIYFFDEARFGTHSNLGHGWFPKGSRTSIDIKLGFQNFYVYSATHINSGDHFSSIISNVDTMCMNAFLQEFAKYLGDKKVLMIMDQAGWHKSNNLKIPENIEIIYLPPYCPELNPVERLWGYIKSNTIKNVIYETITELEKTIYEFIKGLTSATIKSICSVHY